MRLLRLWRIALLAIASGESSPEIVARDLFHGSTNRVNETGFAALILFLRLGRPQADFQFLGAGPGNICLVLNGRGNRIPRDSNVARESRGAPDIDVNIRDFGADIDQRHAIRRRRAVVGFKAIEEGEGLDIHDDRLKAGGPDNLDVLVDEVFFGRDQKDVHFARGAAARGAKHDGIQVHLVNVKGNVLFRFPAKGLLEFRLGHIRELKYSER